MFALYSGKKIRSWLKKLTCWIFRTEFATYTIVQFLCYVASIALILCKNWSQPLPKLRTDMTNPAGHLHAFLSTQMWVYWLLGHVYWLWTIQIDADWTVYKFAIKWFMEVFRSNVTNMNILVIEYNAFVQGVPHHLLDIVLPTEGMQLF